MRPKSAGVVVVDDRAAGVNHEAVFFGQRHIKVFPAQQVRTDSVPPTHVPPQIAKRIVLIEKVPFAIVIDQAVGVVCPIDFRSEVELRPVGFVVSRLLRSQDGGENGDRQEEQLLEELLHTVSYIVFWGGIDVVEIG